MTPTEQTYDYIRTHWQKETVDGRKLMLRQLEGLTVHEKNLFLTRVLEGEIRELAETIRIDIDREIRLRHQRHEGIEEAC
jgi:hypothetical protein